MYHLYSRYTGGLHYIPVVIEFVLCPVTSQTIGIRVHMIMLFVLVLLMPVIVNSVLMWVLVMVVVSRTLHGL